MHGGELAYNPSKLKGNTAVEKLRYFLTEAKSRLREKGLDSGSKVRFRGDVLEVSVDRSELTSKQDEAASDSLIYIKTGLLISVLGKLISEAGYKPVVRTFPRFDEPDLVGFVYIGNNMDSQKRTRQKENNVNKIDGYELYLAERIASKRSLSLTLVDNSSDLKKMRDTLIEGLECCKDSDMSHTVKAEIKAATSKTEHIKTNQNVIIVSSRQNTPTSWIGTGFFFGEMMEEMSMLNRAVKALSLKSCPAHFQPMLQSITQGSARHPQLVFVIEPSQQ
ncbi:MAG: hypothetical protein LAT84_09040 [Balneolia bacterium]|nr:hypothetical protein [Balneolia bacterium]